MMTAQSQTMEISDDLPEIPDKRYFTIGEVSSLCAVKPHVLRYWEQEFVQLKPCKRRGNRRYYQYDDVLIVRRIRTLLYEHGFTIGGARAQLTNKPGEMPPTPAALKGMDSKLIKGMIDDLEDVYSLLSQ